MKNQFKLIIIAVVFGYSCNNYKKVDSNENCFLIKERLVYYPNKPIFDSVCMFTNKDQKTADSISTTQVFIDDYKYIIQSRYIKDSVSNEERNLFYPTVIEQSVHIYNGGKLFSELKLPIKKIEQRLRNGRTLKMAENVLLSFGILKVGDGNLFILEGFGGCNSCPEFRGIYTLDGKIVYEYYGVGETLYVDKENKILADSLGLNMDNMDPKYSRVDLW